MKTLWIPLMLAAAGAATAGSAAAQSRWVFVNGQRMNDAQVLMLARAQCTAISDGRYWLNHRTGAWGYAGNPVQQGVLGERCRTARRQPSLSERGRLYRPGEIINGR